MFNEFLFFIFFSILMIVFSIFVIISKNPVYSILALVLLFFNAGGFLILMGLEFLGMLFLIVYIGAIAVLFLFVVMMLNIKVLNTKFLTFYYFPVIVFTVVTIFFLVQSNMNFLDLNTLVYNFYFNPITFWYFDVRTFDNVFNLGYVLYTFYFYLFLLCGIILLISMLGAISLTLHKRSDVKRQQIFKQVDTNFNTSVKWNL